MREIQFLLNHKETFTNHICEYYPLSEDFIEKSRNYLNWDLLSMNEKLPWSMSFMEKFSDLWDWGCLSVNESLPWSDELIESFIDKWQWDDVNDYSEPCLTENKSIKWSTKIILKYPSKFRGNWISTKCELINECPEILDHFKDVLWWEYISGDEYINWSEEMIEKFKSYWDWEILSGNRSIKWSSEMKKRYEGLFNQHIYEKGNWEMFIHKKNNTYSSLAQPYDDHRNDPKFTPEEFDKVIKQYPIGYFSCDKRVPWSEGLIEMYKAEWNWETLSFNEDLPWTEKLIDKYIDRFDFGTEKENSNGSIYCNLGLSSNPGLPWTKGLMKKYESKWNWEMLTYSEHLPWSIELLEEFEHKWDWDRITWNETMWKKVFYPCIDEEVIGALLTIINKKVYPF